MPEISSPKAGLSIGAGPAGAPTGAPGSGRPSRMRIDRLGTTWMIIAVLMAVVTLFLHRRMPQPLWTISNGHGSLPAPLHVWQPMTAELTRTTCVEC